MLKRLAYQIVTAVAALLLAFGCSDAGVRIAGLQKQLLELEDYCNTLSINAQGVDKMVAAVQAQDALVSFEPIAENGAVVGFKAVFENAGEVTIYNQDSNISVAELDGKYYWTADGQWLLDAAGNKIEITPGALKPGFAVRDGKVAVSVDGGATWQTLGEADKQLITSVVEYADKVVFTLASGTDIIIPKYRPLTLSLTSDNVKIGPGGQLSVRYEISGSDGDAAITAVCGDGWNVKVEPDAQGSFTGALIVTAPSQITDNKVIIILSDSKGRMVAAELQLEIEDSGDDPPDPPEPPVQQTILMPVKNNYEIDKEGGTLTVEVYANVDYTVTSNASWVHHTATRALRKDQLDFTIDANTDIRRGTSVFLTSGNYSTSFVISQGGVPRYLEISVGDMEFDHNAGAQQLIVTSNADYEIEQPQNCDWVILEKTPGPDGDQFVVSVAANDTPLNRNTTITFRYKTLIRKLYIYQSTYIPRVPDPSVHPLPGLPTVVCHLMPCCRVNNAGTKFLIRGEWEPRHDYSDISQVRDILRRVKEAGINVVSIDFTNPSQWDDAGQAALHNSTGEFWSQFKPMLDNIVLVCEQFGMEFFLFIGNTEVWGMDYWNFIAGCILQNWAQSPAYHKYGYGDDRPMLVMFIPGSRFAAQMRRTPAGQKNNLLQFHIGTCQINTAITPTTTDGWGYRNYSASSDGKVRFACPNGGVPPDDWYRIGAAAWRERVQWALGATEYAVLGSYDDTCDAIFWGIADVSGSTSAYHINQETVGDPFVYYNIVRKEVTGLD